MAKKKVKAKATKGSSMYYPRGPRLYGKTLKLGIRRTWWRVFFENAKATKKKRLTDEQIIAFMRKEFPGRKGKVFTSVLGCQRMRSNLNCQGAFGEMPDPPFQAYDGQGEPIQKWARTTALKAKGWKVAKGGKEKAAKTSKIRRKKSPSKV